MIFYNLYYEDDDAQLLDTREFAGKILKLIVRKKTDPKKFERYIDKNNKCIIIGGGLGFIPTIAYHNSKNKMLVFEINNKIITQTSIDHIE